MELVEEDIFFNLSDDIIVISEFTRGLVRKALRRDVKVVVFFGFRASVVYGLVKGYFTTGHKGAGGESKF